MSNMYFTLTASVMSINCNKQQGQSFSKTLSVSPGLALI